MTEALKKWAEKVYYDKNKEFHVLGAMPEHAELWIRAFVAEIEKSSKKYTPRVAYELALKELVKRFGLGGGEL